MEILQTVLLQCPYCWEQIEVVVDCSMAQQEYVEDCEVCCSPVAIRVALTDDGEIDVEARMENG
ncbi:MAG: CPXCG motif-containing cysteine-rich protein [Gammaproteobacteria bacterium]